MYRTGRPSGGRAGSSPASSKASRSLLSFLGLSSLPWSRQATGSSPTRLPASLLRMGAGGGLPPGPPAGFKGPPPARRYLARGGGSNHLGGRRQRRQSGLAAATARAA